MFEKKFTDLLKKVGLLENNLTCGMDIKPECKSPYSLIGKIIVFRAERKIFEHDAERYLYILRVDGAARITSMNTWQSLDASGKPTEEMIIIGITPINAYPPKMGMINSICVKMDGAVSMESPYAYPLTDIEIVG